MNGTAEMATEETKEKWVLEYGIHRGTITSRDSTSSEHDSEELARKAWSDAKAFHRSIGYMTWFSYLHTPDGRKITLDYGMPYR